MLAEILLLGLLLVATYTDLRWGYIYNWNTYSGIVLALAVNGAGSLFGFDAASATPEQFEFFGLVGIAESLWGLLACGGVMVVCYVFFAGGVGGGDIKLVAMMGAFLGLYSGLEAMLWTMIVGGCIGLISLVWQVGALELAGRGCKYIALVLRHRTLAPLTDEEQQPLKTRLPLSLGALAAALIVYFQLLDWFVV
jgi:prepilin peptidase CpaA